MVHDADIAFANWNQLLTAIARVRDVAGDSPVVDDLLRALGEISTPEVEDYLPEPPTLWRVGELRFTIEQEGYGPKSQDTMPPAHV